MIRASKQIVFFGTEDFSLITLRALVEAGFDVAAVVTKPDTPRGRGHTLTKPLVKTFALEHQIPVLQPHKLSEIAARIEALDSPLGVLVSFGKIIPQSIIDLFTPGIINIHPSLLPKYRGPSPIESAIVNGDQETGVSLIQLTAQMDAGPIYAYSPLELTGRETKPELYDTLGSMGTTMLLQLLPGIMEGEITTPAPQVDSDATYCALLQKSDGVIDPTNLTAAEAERRVRAYLGFPKTRIDVNNSSLIILAAHVTDSAHSDLDILCADGNYLAIDELIAPSGKRMDAESYLRGLANKTPRD